MKRLLLMLLILPFILGAAPSRQFTYKDGKIIEPNENNTNENALFNYLSSGVDTYSPGSIENADVSASANIAVTKIAGIAATTTTDQTISGDKTFTGADTFSGTPTISGTLDITGNLTLDGAAGTSGQTLKSEGSGVTPTWVDAIVSGTSAGGDLTGTYPNPTLDTNVVDSTNISTSFMGCFSKAVAYQSNTLILAGTLTNKWIIFSGYLWVDSEANAAKYIPGGANDANSLGEVFRGAGDDVAPVQTGGGTSDVDLTIDKLAIFSGRFYTESGMSAPTATQAFNEATPASPIVVGADAANEFVSDCYLYMDSTSFDLMLHLGDTSANTWMGFSIFITVLPDTAL